MENVGVDHIHPEWKMMDQFFLDKFQVSTALDQLTNSHPIMAEVKDPAQINSLFDSISYDKVSENPQSHGCWNYWFTCTVQLCKSEKCDPQNNLQNVILLWGRANQMIDENVQTLN